MPAMLSTLRAGVTSHRIAAVGSAFARRKSAMAGLNGSMNGSAKSWVPSSGDQLERAVANSMIMEMSQNSFQIVEKIVPWYLNSLPASYFMEVSEATRMEHLKGLVALRGISHAEDLSLTLTSVGTDQKKDVTVLRTQGKPGVLREMLKYAAKTGDATDELERVRAFTAEDGSLTLNIFTYGHEEDGMCAATAEDGAEHMRFVTSDEERKSLAQFLSMCRPEYARSTSPDRLVVHKKLYEAVKGTDRAEVIIDESLDGNNVWINVAAANAMPEILLWQIVSLCYVRGFDIGRLFLDRMRDPSNGVGEAAGSVCMIRILCSRAEAAQLSDGVKPFPGSLNDVNSDAWKEMRRSIRRLKWLDSTTLDLGLYQCPEFGIERAEILAAFSAMLHGPLSKIDALSYSRYNLRALMANPFYTQFFIDIADLFIARFDPTLPLPTEIFASQCKSLRARLGPLTNESARIALLKFVDAVELTLRTNFFMPGRYALALRVDPSIMVAADQDKPFGVIFVHGQSFDGFHNRFQNIARGGLRLVTPSSSEQYAMESSRCYDEVYSLSHAQQLKNKDIPEGGSKAVVLVDVSQVSDTQRNHVLRNSVKGFTDAILDLIVTSEDTRKHMVDHLGFDELIYLGPDEQVVPEDINWIIQQAAKRGYPIPAAFMSSKPLAGINHKEYGVTSEGVAVFLDVALRNRGINPDEDEFTIKITGGPDGDVAGNLMRILFRDYGDRAKIVGVADGSGCAEDPAGLSHAELLRLFRAALPIADLDSSSLSPDGALHLANTEEGVRLRNNMYARVRSDVFVPAGGRPNTMHGGNWENFLIDGVPSSPLIVEGANIFVTAEARQKLHEHAGVDFIKDSSANKCGVITSSYEICASMLLDEEEFLEIKEELVNDVLQRLRELARMEADVLFREYLNYPGALPGFSERISQAINSTQAAIWKDLAGMQRGDEIYEELLPLFHEYLPKKLAEVAADRIDERIPLDYMRSAFSSCLASKLLYREGLHFLESQPKERIFSLSRQYVREEKHVADLVETVQKVSKLSEKDLHRVTQLLRRGGVRSALQVY